MTSAQTGNTVLVHYKGELGNGSVFDQSKQEDPLQFTIGDGQLIQDFEEAVIGMNQGEKKTIEIPADRAYGLRRDDLMIEVERTQFPDHITPEVGQKLQLTQPDGYPLTVTISKVEEVNVTLDANHPLAGEDLTFEIQLVEIVA